MWLVAFGGVVRTQRYWQPPLSLKHGFAWLAEAAAVGAAMTPVELLMLLPPSKLDLSELRGDVLGDIGKDVGELLSSCEAMSWGDINAARMRIRVGLIINKVKFGLCGI